MITTMAHRIAKARQDLGMTQQELASRLCVTNKAVSRWETGTGTPDISLLLPLSRILGISLSQLLDDKTGPVPDSYASSLSLNRKQPARTDAASDQTEIIRIDTDNTLPLSPYLFGHNLEHTRACISGGLSAQMLRNRKFAGKPSRNEGCAAEWFAIGGKNALFILDEDNTYFYDAPYTRHLFSGTMKRKNETQAMVVQGLTENACCGIGQQGLFVRAGRTYELRITARTVHPLPLTVSLTDRSGSRVLAQKEILLDSGDWQTCGFTLTPDADQEEASLRCFFTGRARVIFGALSMLPEGHFHGMRRDVIECLKEIGVSILRWPGGNFAGEYRWQDGLLPVDQRAPLQSFMEMETQPYSQGYDNHEIGTDEFMALCREIGAEPFLTINLAWASPEENAAWVEYCNGGTETVYGRLRAERGYPEPYHVRFWSLGNEMGYGHMEGPSTPESYASLARRQAKAMLAVCPDLQLFSSGPYPNADWAEKSARELKDLVGSTSLHYYAYTNLDYSDREAAERTCQSILAAPREVYSLLHEMRACLGSGLHISFDEWNYWYSWFRPSSTAEALYAAGILHLLLQESGPMDIPVCCYFQPVGEGAILVGPDDCSLTPTGQIFSLMKAHRGGRLCPLPQKEAPDCAATVRDGILTVTLLNTDLHTSRSFVLQLQGTAREGLLLFCDSLLPHSVFTCSPLRIQSGEDGFRAELPPHSAALVQFELKE